MTDTNRVLSHAAFRNHLSQVKGTIQREGWDWYPYHSIENAPRIASLLEQAGVAFEELIRGGPVLDIGCGDGEMAFFLEDLGAEVAHPLEHTIRWLSPWAFFTT